MDWISIKKKFHRQGTLCFVYSSMLELTDQSRINGMNAGLSLTQLSPLHRWSRVGIPWYCIFDILRIRTESIRCSEENSVYSIWLHIITNEILPLPGNWWWKEFIRDKASANHAELLLCPVWSRIIIWRKLGVWRRDFRSF